MNLTPHRLTHSRQRGMAVVVAMSILTFVAVAAAMISQTVLHDAQRTRLIAEDSQMRQLLGVGAKVAWDEVKGQPADAEIQSPVTQITLPGELAARGGQLTVQIETLRKGIEVRAEVHATLDDRQAQQTLLFGQSDLGWTLVDAKLGG